MTIKHLMLSGLAMLAMGSPGMATAQQAGEHIVSIYHAAPGHQEALIKWLAQQERISDAAGVPRGQLYIHMDGADWDYVHIQPELTDAQEAAVDAAAKKLGLDAGLRAGLEFRKHITSHTDTIAWGPTNATDYLKALGGD